MASSALAKWQGTRAAELDGLEAVQHALRDAGSQRMATTQQVNRAWAMLLSSHFQGFCRDLHTEALDCLLEATRPEKWQRALRRALLSNRALDRGNPHAGAIGHDFNGLGMALWELVDAADKRNRRRRDLLDELNRWRNAIAHQDFDPAALGGRTTVTVGMIRSWRAACDMLALSFDLVVGRYAAAITNTVPW
jgi:hypothetical protein